MGCRRRNMQPAIKKTQCLSDPIITDLLNITIFFDQADATSAVAMDYCRPIVQGHDRTCS